MTRVELVELLQRWRARTASPEEVVLQSRERWLAGDAPPDDPVATDVLVMLATAQHGLTHEDIPVLLAWLEAGPGEERAAFERVSDWLIGHADARSKVRSTRYYGAATDLEEDLDFYYRTPEERRIHRAAREDPETIWEQLRNTLCEPLEAGDRALFWDDILEDLVVYHEDRFIERLEALARDCPASRGAILGVTEQVGERFADLQWQLQRELDATR